MDRTCPICGETYNEPSAISRTDNVTQICSSCGIRQALEPFLAAGIMNDSNVESIVSQNKEMNHHNYN